MYSSFYLTAVDPVDSESVREYLLHIRVKAASLILHFSLILLLWTPSTQYVSSFS
jgi:hypothetical protein